MPLNRILIASDFSKHADYALKRAVTIAEDNQAALYFVHVLNQSWMANLVELPLKEPQARLLKARRESEKKLLDLLKKEAQSQNIQAAVLTGRIAEEISTHAKENRCDLIVVGAHGEYYLNDYILGTTPGALIGQGGMPLLIIKEKPAFSYGRILIATDFSKASKKAVEFCFDCFPEACFQLLHVVDVYYQRFFDMDIKHPTLPENEQTRDIWHKVDHFLNDCNVDAGRFEKKIVGGYTADAISMQAEKWQADLLVFGSQGHSKLHYFLLGSTAQRLMHLSPLDMLAVPPSGE